MSMRAIYMDHAATTMVSDGALQEMLPYFREAYGNPSAIYSYGQTAKNAVEKCRERVAKCIGALKSEIYFTSGGTESDNWAIRSACRMKRDKGKHIISSAIEHNAVRKTLEQMEEDGYAVTYLKPNAYGQITESQLEEAIRPDTVLITIMLANNVIGTIADIKALAAVAKRHRIFFHTDAVQAAGHIPINVRQLGIDFLSISGHKFNDPKGVGVLYSRIPVRLPAYMTGGGQEREGRSGTENVPGIVGLTHALEENVRNLSENTIYLQGLAERMNKEILEIPGIIQTGDPERRLPGFCSFVVEGIQHSVLLVNKMNDKGVCISSGSACSASSKEASHVLLALGYDKQLAGNSVRITLGTDNTETDVDYAIKTLKNAINEIRTEYVTRAPRLEGRVKEV